MPFSEEELRRRLQQGTSPPGEEETDALWAAIAGELPAGAAGGAVATAGRNWWWMLLPGLLLVMIGFAVFPGPEATDDPDELTSAEMEPAELPAARQAASTENGSVSAQRPIGVAMAAPTPALGEPRMTLPVTTATTATSSPTPHPRPRPLTTSVDLPKERLVKTSTQLLPVAEVAPLATTLIIKSPTVNYEETTVTFKRSSRLVLGGAAGANVLWESYEGGTESAPVEGLQAGLRTAPGQQARLSVGYRLGQGFTMHTGLGYTRTHTVLDHGIAFDTLAPHPSFSDQTTAGLARYSITHNNRLAWLSLPLGLSYERQLGRVVVGLGVGASLNYQLSAAGRLPVSRSRSEAFGGTSETDRLHLSYYLAPEVSLPLAGSESLRLCFRGRAERLDFGVSSATGLRRRGWLLGGSVGLRKDF